MSTPFHRLSKDDIVWLSRHYCKHNHRYVEHYQCYLKEQPNRNERVGFLDIESSNLDANFGIMLSYCIKDGSSDSILYNVINKNDIEKYEPDKTDTRIVEMCVSDMMKFDRIVAHYGIKFDIPFIRTRALACGLYFPPYSTLRITDTWRIAKNKLKLNSNRLDVIEQALFGQSDKTRVEGKHWIAGTRGNKKSLGYILDHNKIDVISLERVYYKLIDFVKNTNTSI